MSKGYLLTKVCRGRVVVRLPKKSKQESDTYRLKITWKEQVRFTKRKQENKRHSLPEEHRKGTSYNRKKVSK